MPLMDRVNNVRSSVAGAFSSLRQSLSVENVRALPGKFIAGVVAAFSAVVNFLVVKPATWVWSNVPAGPQPSLWSRVSNWLFAPSKSTQIKTLQKDKEELNQKIADLNVGHAAKDTEKTQLTGKVTELVAESKRWQEQAEQMRVERDAALAPKPAVTPLADAAKKPKSRIERMTSGVSVVTKRMPLFRGKKNSMEG